MYENGPTVPESYKPEILLTSTEHPIIDSRSTALTMTTWRFGGGF